MHRLFYRTFTAALLFGSAVPANAATLVDSMMASNVPGSLARTATGTYNGMTYTATNNIVGTTSTATGVAGGNPAFFATGSRYSGTVALIMAYSNGDRFICSGSLMADRQSILTAGHCVSGGAGTANPVSTTAYFYNGTDPDYVITGAASTAITVSNYFVNAGYTGEVIDQNDIAVLRLSQAAPLFATSYEVYTGNASGQNFNVTGVGGRSDTGGSVGANLGTGRKRQGDNMYDFALGDEGIDGGLDFLSENGAEIDNVLLSDFDNGLAANDSSCIVADAIGVTSSRYCNLGRGATEAMTAGGDSGGASFIDGKVAAVTSFGLSFGSEFGDIDDNLNSTYGEFGGYVSTAYHANWINSVLAVPEPGTWALMLTGFGMTGIALRRSRRRVRVAFA